MRITWNELTISFDPTASEALLSDWGWLVTGDLEVVVVSALGDLFLRNSEGHILWLDVGAARITQVAASSDEFKQLMQMAENANDWFVPQLIGDLIARGKLLSPGQCYSYKKPPMLSGELTVDNLEPTDLLVHCSICGQIGRKIQQMPEGTKIDGFTFDDGGS
jgi:hypothetical protein